MGWISISGWKFWRISASIGTPSDHSAIVLERSITENIVDSHSCSSSVLFGPSTPVMSENLGRRLFTSPSSGYSSTSTIKSWRSFSSTISWRGWHESIDDSDGTRDVEELQGDLVIRTIEWRTGKQSRNFKWFQESWMRSGFLQCQRHLGGCGLQEVVSCLDLRVGWNGFQVGYAWFMMPMGQSWKRPSTLHIRLSILETMIRPWEARDCFIFFSRISVDTARLRIWSRGRSLHWALPSRMVLNSFVWSGKSSLCFRDLRPWDIVSSVWSFVWRRQIICLTLWEKCRQRSILFIPCWKLLSLRVSWLMSESAKVISFCCTWGVCQAKCKSFFNCIRMPLRFSSFLLEFRITISGLEFKVTWVHSMWHSLCRSQMSRTRHASIVERRAIWQKIVRNQRSAVIVASFHLSWGFLFIREGWTIWTKLRGKWLRNRKLPGSKHGIQNKEFTERNSGRMCEMIQWVTPLANYESYMGRNYIMEEHIWGLSRGERSVSPFFTSRIPGSFRVVVFGFCVWWGLFGVFRLLFPFEAFQAFA